METRRFIDPVQMAWDAYQRAIAEYDCAAMQGRSTDQAECSMQKAEEYIATTSTTTLGGILRKLELVAHVEAYDRDIKRGTNLIAPRVVKGLINDLKSALRVT